MCTDFHFLLQKTEKTEFLGFFYKHSMHVLTAPLFAHTVDVSPSKGVFSLFLLELRSPLYLWFISGPWSKLVHALFCNRINRRKISQSKPVSYLLQIFTLLNIFTGSLEKILRITRFTWLYLSTYQLDMPYILGSVFSRVSPCELIYTIIIIYFYWN